MQNFPKPLIRISSPFSSVFFIISKTDSMRPADLALGRSSRLWTESVRWALVMVID
jgi:hypothetical protein